MIGRTIWKETVIILSVGCTVVLMYIHYPHGLLCSFLCWAFNAQIFEQYLTSIRFWMWKDRFADLREIPSGIFLLFLSLIPVTFLLSRPGEILRCYFFPIFPTGSLVLLYNISRPCIDLDIFKSLIMDSNFQCLEMRKRIDGLSSCHGIDNLQKVILLLKFYQESNFEGFKFIMTYTKPNLDLHSDFVFIGVRKLFFFFCFAKLFLIL